MHVMGIDSVKEMKKHAELSDITDGNVIEVYEHASAEQPIIKLEIRSGIADDTYSIEQYSNYVGYNGLVYYDTDGDVTPDNDSREGIMQFVNKWTENEFAAIEVIRGKK